MSSNKRVVLKTASNSEIKSGGKGWQITAGFAKSPFGTCAIAESPRGICHLSFADSKKKNAALRAIQEEWPKAQLRRNDASIVKLADTIFKKRNSNGSKPILFRTFVKGTKFQAAVWKTLLKIPQGTLTSYGHLAKAVGKPKAARAVGSAVGQNPVAYLIPCHRVIRKTGAIGDYHWGAAQKRAIIAWENT